MKIFLVTVDNNPGGWKSGNDPSTLVLANDVNDAIQKVKGGWWDNLEWSDENGKREYFRIYGKFNTYTPVREDSVISAMEIKFMLEGYEVEVFNIRKKKLDKINENISNSE